MVYVYVYFDQVGYGAFLGASMNMPSQAKGLVQIYAYRQLLQVCITIDI